MTLKEVLSRTFFFVALRCGSFALFYWAAGWKMLLASVVFALSLQIDMDARAELAEMKRRQS